MKCSGENMILREKVHVVSCFPLHFMLYRGNLDYFSDSVDISDFQRFLMLRVKVSWFLDQISNLLLYTVALYRSADDTVR